MQRIRSGKADRNFGDTRTSGVTSGRGGAAVRAGGLGIDRLILARGLAQPPTSPRAVSLPTGSGTMCRVSSVSRHGPASNSRRTSRRRMPVAAGRTSGRVSGQYLGTCYPQRGLLDRGDTEVCDIFT